MNEIPYRVEALQDRSGVRDQTSGSQISRQHPPSEVNPKSRIKRLRFKVSAKTARLIGRENVSNAEAAVSELIKNTYDADATICLVCFLPRYRSVPNQIKIEEFIYLRRKLKTIEDFYSIDSDSFATLRTDECKTDEQVYDLVKQLTDVWIIDNGSGMTAETIEKCWMVIGTNDKEVNALSAKGRARTGAKGIGRFALDRLGNTCSLYSTSGSKGAMNSIRWDVDWSQFDGTGKVLDDISTRLEQDAKPIREVLSSLDSYPQIMSAKEELKLSSANWSTGTAIRIGLLRDNWTKRDVVRLDQTLRVLIPPVEQKELNLFLFDASSPDEFGFVSNEVLEDYDYKLEANISNEGKVFFDLYRNELEPDKLDPALFQAAEMMDPRFSVGSFGNRRVSYSKTATELFPAGDEAFFRRLHELGPFQVQILFFKKGIAKRDKEIYPYRDFQPGHRKKWLDEFGGIKIYRDNFAVRPYGEIKGRAFDWLSLGQRVAISPVAASRKGWRVTPQNLAGTVTISRVQNPRLEDQTNREGIIENHHFAVFREVVLRTIQEFEEDRSRIHYNLNELYKRKNKIEGQKEKGTGIADKILTKSKQPTPDDAVQLAQALISYQEEIKDLQDEQIMLRALATLGTVLVSFSHEMGQLQNAMGFRSKDLSGILRKHIPKESLVDVPDALNPYRILQDWGKDDMKVKHWFTFVLTAIQSGRRHRRRISLRNHLEATKKIWAGFLQPRGIDLAISDKDGFIDAQILAFEIDLDSIFNNLILNSVEAFLTARHKGRRKIDIEIGKSEDCAKIHYRDSGPGIDSSIQDASEIFDFTKTTKRGADGEINGTGLGMWILKTIVSSYGGSCRVLNYTHQPGFHFELILPRIRENEG